MSRLMLIVIVAGLSGCALANNEEAPAPVPAASLEGTDIDGDLRADAEGKLVVDDDTRRLFDYFLTAEGEIPHEQIRDLVWREAKRRLPAAVVDDTMALFDQYVRYRDRVAQVLQSQNQSLAGAAEKIRAIRQQTVGDYPVFAADDRTLAQAVALSRGDAPERAVQRAEILLQLHRARAGANGELSAAELYRLRAEKVGTAAADRLAALDRHRREWDRRLKAYYKARAELACIADPVKRSRAVQALLDQRFSEREQLRVRAIERIRDEH